MKSLDKIRALQTIRVRTAGSNEEFDRMVGFCEAERMRVMYRGQDAILFKQRTWGGILAHLGTLVLFFWTLGIANVVLAIVSRQNAAEIIVRRSSDFSSDFETAWQKSRNKASDVSTAGM